MAMQTLPVQDLSGNWVSACVHKPSLLAELLTGSLLGLRVSHSKKKKSNNHHLQAGQEHSLSLSPTFPFHSSSVVFHYVEAAGLEAFEKPFHVWNFSP